MPEEISYQEEDLGRVGRCIYCGATADLRDEHLIPHGLGGGAQLFDATCGSCAVKTSAFERLVLRDQLLPFRSILGLPTYHANNRPREFPARVQRGGEWTYESLPTAKYTAIGAFPDGRPPRPR